jgi:hypothetical protein
MPYLRRGVLAGLAGGAAMAAFLLVVGERSIRQALAIEAAASRGEEAEVFSRSTQLAGGAAAALLYGILAGAVFGVVFAAVRHRSRLGDDFSRSVGLAGVAFGTLVLVPALKYPANPPAVGDPDTIGDRTVAYLTLVGLSVVATVAAWQLSRHLRAQGLADHERVPLVALAYLALVALGYLAWPASPDQVTVPAQLIWRFRLAALGGAAALWAVIGVVFGLASLRAASPERRAPATNAAA